MKRMEALEKKYQKIASKTTKELDGMSLSELMALRGNIIGWFEAASGDTAIVIGEDGKRELKQYDFAAVEFALRQVETEIAWRRKARGEMTEQELRPCAHCGHEAKMEFREMDDPNDPNDASVTCSNFECEFGGWWVRPSVWNKRPVEDALVAYIATLEAEVEALRPYRDGYDPKDRLPEENKYEQELMQRNTEEREQNG